VLREAGAQDADMLVAVTNSDETNMVACQVAYSLFNTPNKVARIRSPPIWWSGIACSCPNPSPWIT
jgi:trk system potassium uptake protein TrkA